MPGPGPHAYFKGPQKLWDLDRESAMVCVFPDESSRRVIIEAFAEFERFTCIRFVAYQGHRDFISILPMSG